MTVFSVRRTLLTSGLRRHLLWCLAGLLALAWPLVVVGQDSADAAQPSEDWLFSDTLTGRSGEAIGGIIRLGVETEAYSHPDTIVPLEFMPYFFVEEGMFFGDMRVFRSTQDRYGANLGVGYRQYFSSIDRIFGVNGYFDYDNTSGQLFRQAGIGVETLGRYFDARVNGYFPTGETEKILSENIDQTSARFEGHNIFYDIIRINGEALKGIDGEIGAPLPGAFLTRHDVRIFAGVYAFDGNNRDPFVGWKGRLQGNAIAGLQLGLEVTNDSEFDTHVVFNAAWSYGGFRGRDGAARDQFTRMTTPVKRNYTITVSRTPEVLADNIAINPVTDQPYFIDHVASYATAPGDGTVENPFVDIPSERLLRVQKPDIVFVHADSEYDGGTASQIVMESGIRYLGEGNGVTHLVDVPGFPSGLVLPRATTGTNRPLFTNSPGDGITLAGDTEPDDPRHTQPYTEVAGFVFGDPSDVTSGPSGIGISGTGIQNVTVRQIDVNYAGSDGIRLVNSQGDLNFLGVNVLNPTGVGLRVTGGSGQISYIDLNETTGNATIVKDNNAELLVLVENTVNDGSSFVSFVEGAGRFASLEGDGSAGVLVQSAAGSTTFGDMTIANSPLTSFNVQGGSGTVTIRGESVITGSADDAFNIENRAAGSVVRISGDVAITEAGARGFDFLNNAGDIIIRNSNTTISQADSATTAAIEYQGSSGSVLFGPGTADQILPVAAGTLEIDGSSNNNGIQIGGIGNANSGRFIDNMLNTSVEEVVTGISIVDDDSTVTFNGQVQVGATGGRLENGINIDATRGDVLFNRTVTIGNASATDRAAIRIDGNDNAIAFAEVNMVDIGNGAVGIDPGAGLTLTNNPGTVTFDSLNVSGTAGGVGVYARDAGVLDTDLTDGIDPTSGLVIANGVIDIENGRAVDIEDSVINVGFESVSVSGAYDFGINLQNNQASSGSHISFAVTGTDNTVGSGGIIDGATAAAVRVNNTERVSLTGMQLSNSLRGVDATAGTTGVRFASGQISEMTVASVDAVNTPFLTVINSILDSGDPATPSPEIRLVASAIPVDTEDLDNDGDFTEDIGYTVVVNGNNINEQNADAITLTTVTGGAGATINASIQNNIINLFGTGTDDSLDGTVNGVLVSWQGPIDGLIDGNEITMTGGNSTGININSRGGVTNASLDLDIISNSITGLIGGNTGIGVRATGPSRVAVGLLNGAPGSGNVIDLTDTNVAFNLSNGMQFRLAANSDTAIVNNNITLTNTTGFIGQTNGIVFRQIAEPALLTIAGNNIDIEYISTGVFISANLERGISFEAATGTIDLFRGFSTRANNIVTITNGYVFPNYFFAPSNIAFDGSILINGVPYPQ